jgi:DMSO/TMAO reductase YedYZ molybdopterin-dependent catalytic subunit
MELRLFQRRVDKSSRICRGFLLLALLFMAGVASVHGQQPAVPAGRQGAALFVGGEVVGERSWTMADLAALPQVEVKTVEKDGKAVTFKGVSLASILQGSGTPFGEQLRGAALSLAVLVKAADGYQAIFALAELDPAMTDKQVLLAEQADGQPLPPEVGPLRLIVPDEKRHARWVRRVISLEVIRVASATAPPSAPTKDGP